MISQTLPKDRHSLRNYDDCRTLVRNQGLTINEELSWFSDGHCYVCSVEMTDDKHDLVVTLNKLTGNLFINSKDWI